MGDAVRQRKHHTHDVFSKLDVEFFGEGSVDVFEIVMQQGCDLRIFITTILGNVDHHLQEVGQVGHSGELACLLSECSRYKEKSFVESW